MAPGVLSDSRNSPRRVVRNPIHTKSVALSTKDSLLNRNVKISPYRLAKGEDSRYIRKDGTSIYDASGGAAVANLGRYNKRVEKAMRDIFRLGLSYVPSVGFDTDITAELADFMITSTNGKMRKAVFYCSGSEASEAALKMAVQYHGKEKSPAEPSRTLFIAREQSYHGATLGALDVSGHEARKSTYRKILPKNTHTVPPCHPYRNKLPGQTNEEYVQWHREQLVKKVEELGKENVAAFIMEPVVGAALGCAPAVPGYLKAMREVCDHYGILLIFDEVMCGMGRTGYLHAWQADNVVPDIQLAGKGLAGGFVPVSAMLVGHKIIESFEKGPSNGAFIHGHTFQNHPMGAAVALEVQKIIQDENLLENVREKGTLLEKKLRERLEPHRYIGNIRGPKGGLFFGIEFVENKDTKMPFNANENISMKIYDKGLTSPYDIHVYPGAGSVDGCSGDHILIAPAYNITYAEVDLIVDRVFRLVDDFFNEYDNSRPKNL
ncbi:pyridoxal phosphate-dependent transferase [Phaeosphaeriaceae sp. PMI808]|nr:pyridoxal phosphate-dependent transferase [Phaeosphaeriaceae sp. PMI808]